MPPSSESRKTREAIDELQRGSRLEKNKRFPDQERNQH